MCIQYTYYIYVRTYNTGELPEIKSAARTGSHPFAQSWNSMKELPQRDPPELTERFWKHKWYVMIPDGLSQSETHTTQAAEGLQAAAMAAGQAIPAAHQRLRRIVYWLRIYFLYIIAPCQPVDWFETVFVLSFWPYCGERKLVI